MRTLDAAFASAIDVPPSVGVGVASLNDDTARNWLRAVHAVFYGSKKGSSVSFFATSTGGGGGSGSKFLALEAALTAALTRRVARSLASESQSQYQQQQPVDHSVETEAADGALALVVRALLLLSQESGATRTKRQIDARKSPVTSTKSKDKASASQPYTPLAFILANALKNLTLQREDAALRARVVSRCEREGQANAALVELCTRGLTDPNTVVRTLVSLLLTFVLTVAAR